MTVTVNVERKAVELLWDTDVATGDTVTISATNPDRPDDPPSTREVDNDGHATVTYPADYHGTSDIEVIGSDGGSDVGSITV